jgi:transcriptional regulator with XRE-family HTH domain
LAVRFSGALLRQKRVGAGLRPEQLAFAVGRSVFSVHQYERGAATPSVAVLASFAEVFACPVDDFFARDAA